MAVIPAELMKEYVRKGISELGYQPRFNELSQQMQNGEEQWKDADYSKLHIELRNIAPASYIDDMVRVVAEENKFHPALNWIREMRAAGWDGNDWIHQLATYFDNPDGMFETYLRKWMIGVVDKLQHEGVRNPMLVLDGAQESGKSSFVKWLCPRALVKYFREGQIIPTDKDYRLALIRTVVWEVSEVDATTGRAEASALKDFLTKQTVKERDAYAREAIERPAIASFIGTFNNISGFLNDASGSTRFRVCQLTRINWRGYTTDPDDLQELIWRQAVALYDMGETNELDTEQKQEMISINKNYILANNTRFALEEYFDIDPQSESFTSSNYIREILQNHGLHGLDLDAKRIASCLIEFGCKPTVRKVNNKSRRGWVGISKRLIAEIQADEDV